MDDNYQTTDDGRCAYRFFGRAGGTGSGRYESLNVSFSVGDQPDVALENRRVIKRLFGIDRLVSARQVHGDKVWLLSDVAGGDLEIEGVDALITRHPGVGLLIQQADCQAVLLYDPKTPAIAAVHCGWRGSVANIIGRTIKQLQQQFNTDPSRLQAFIGPSLGPCCAEFIHFERELPEQLHRFQVAPAYFDFWQISRQQLVEGGVRAESIQISGICTSCCRDYFSYRRACREGDGITGRHCSVIALLPQEQARMS